MAGQFSAAEQTARQALAIAPTDPRVHMLLGFLLASIPEKREEAIRHLQVPAPAVLETYC